MPKLEKEIETHLVWAVEMKGGKAFKFKSPNHRGVSDRVVCMPDGTTWFIELKRDATAKRSELQVEFAGVMQKLKQNYAVLMSVDEIDLWIARECC